MDVWSFVIICSLEDVSKYSSGTLKCTKVWGENSNRLEKEKATKIIPLSYHLVGWNIFQNYKDFLCKKWLKNLNHTLRDTVQMILIS